MKKLSKAAPQKELKIHRLLSFLIQPLSEQAYENLALDLIEYGCKDPIVAWNGYIIDGHKRYEICRHYNIPYEVEKIQLANLPEAVSHICRMQLARDDLTCERRKYLIGKLYQAQRDMAEREQKMDPASVQKLSGVCRQSRRKLAAHLGLSTVTVSKYRFYEQALDTIIDAAPHLGQEILSGVIRISHDNTLLLGRRSPEEIRNLSREVENEKLVYLKQADILRFAATFWQAEKDRKALQGAARETDNSLAPIKRMPAYDPDAEVSSLAFTIPSWCSMINRTQNCSNLNNISSPARSRLIGQLKTLQSQAGLLLETLKEFPE